MNNNFTPLGFILLFERFLQKYHPLGIKIKRTGTTGQQPRRKR